MPASVDVPYYLLYFVCNRPRKSIEQIEDTSDMCDRNQRIDWTWKSINRRWIHRCEWASNRCSGTQIYFSWILVWRTKKIKHWNHDTTVESIPSQCSTISFAHIWENGVGKDHQQAAKRRKQTDYVLLLSRFRCCSDHHSVRPGTCLFNQRSTTNRCRWNHRQNSWVLIYYLCI